MIGADTSVLVRYLIGSPREQARRAARTMDSNDLVGITTVALAECAHVLRTQYGVPQRDIIESLIGLIQRENVRVLGTRAESVIEMLVRARDLPDRRIPDALIVAATRDAGALPLATFDHGQDRYVINVRQP